MLGIRGAPVDVCRDESTHNNWRWTRVRMREDGALARTRLALVLILVVVMVMVGISLASPTGASPAHRHRHPHRQALHGSLKSVHVKIVTVLISGGKGGIGDPGDDYPARWKNAPMDSMLDQWREYNRECTSFVAWALYSRNGVNVPFYDNANNWGPDAAKRGYTVNGTPVVGSVAWSKVGTYGHVAYVVAVNGGSVTIEEYNHNYTGTYGKRTVPVSTFTGYIHFKDTPVEPVLPPAPTSAPTLPETHTSTPTPQPVSSSPILPYVETTGGVTHTWANYTNAGGTQGPSIPTNTAVQVACTLAGFRVADGDMWWYRIASSPWNGAYYASADAFYNNGQTSGSLIGTPFVDPGVPGC
jgi:surface antigen